MSVASTKGDFPILMILGACEKKVFISRVIYVIHNFPYSVRNQVGLLYAGIRVVALSTVMPLASHSVLVNQKTAIRGRLGRIRRIYSLYQIINQVTAAIYFNDSYIQTVTTLISSQFYLGDCNTPSLSSQL